MDDPQLVAVACVVVSIVIYAVRWYTNPLNSIPTVGGSSLPGLSYLTAWHTVHNCREILQDGYRKYPDSVFKIAMFDCWVVIAAGRNMVEELRKRPEELSASLGLGEVVQARYLRDPQVLSDTYHVRVVKEKLTGRTLQHILPDVMDEIPVAVGGLITTDGNGWTSVEVIPAMQNIIVQANNRAFVGLPLCRNETYIRLAMDFEEHNKKWGAILGLVPDFIRLAIAPFINEIKHDTSRAVALLRPMIEERMKALADFGEGWNDKPNDVLQFLLDKAIPKGETLHVIAHRLLIVNLAATGSPSQTATHVLYHLAENPDLLQPLREEIEANTSVYGWTNTAMGNMWKLDSILRETLRYHGIALVSVLRKATKDIVLSDGTRVPKGTLVQAAAYPLHRDDSYLENANVFDPFRYARMRSVEGESLKHQPSTTSQEYIPFGHGQHAWCVRSSLSASQQDAGLTATPIVHSLAQGGISPQMC
ncbi:cytochrome P450 [Ganoderma leucocontextum]|nr:cytochrome P450 [Ganoderma leucocontextum]